MPSIYTWAESYSGQTDERVKITVNFTVSQDTSANTSTITITSIDCYYNYDYYAGRSFYIDGTITINGSQAFYANYKSANVTVGAASFETYTISGGTYTPVTITHDSSGAATATFVFSNVNSNVSGFAGVNDNHTNYQFFVRDSEDKTKTYSLPTIDQWPGYSWYNLGYNDGTGSASVAFDLTENQVGYYWYWPPSDGTITIYSTGSTDTYGGWGTGMSLSSTQTYGDNIVSGESYTNDDDGDGNNFKCTNIPVTGGDWAGQVFVHGYNNAASGTLYIDFTPSSYTITFDANGGSGAPNAVSCAPGESVTIPTTKPTRTNMIFLGWSGLSNATFSTAAYLPGATYTPTENKTLYAVWGYKLTINPNGGTMINSSYYDSNNQDSYTTSSDSYTVGFTKTSSYGRDLANFQAGYWYRTVNSIKYYNIPLRTGYTFNGWTVTSGNGQVVYEAPNTTHLQLFYNDNKYCYVRSIGTDYGVYYYINNETTPSNSTITAQWIANTYYVAYNSNGGSGTMNNSTHTYNTASNLSTNTFTYTGYKFIGWNTDSEATTALYTDGQSITNLSSTNGATITLYAIWALDSFTVTLNAKTGIDSVSGGGSKTVGDSVTINATLKTGYRWTGWFNSGTTTMISDAQNYTFTMPASDVSYDAFGHKNTYKVAYEANGGSGTMTTSTFYYDTDETLTPNSFTRLGYTFQGWATSLANAEAGTVTYTDGATVRNLTAVQDEVITLYAIWKPATNMFIWTNGAWKPALKYVYTTQ